MKKFVAAIAALFSAANVVSAADPEVGQTYVCPSEASLPPVFVVVGKLENLSDHGIAGEEGAQRLAHLQLRGDGVDFPVAGHAPFALETLTHCQSVSDHGLILDPERLNDGYSVWLKAFQDEGAGFFTISPAEAYWMMLGVIEGEGQ